MEDAKKANLERLLKWGGGLLGVVLLGFLAPLIVSGAIGLGVGVITIAIGYVGVQMWPVFTRKIVNARYKLIASEARHNPVETNRRIYGEREKVLSAKAEAIKRFEGKLANVNDTIVSLRHQYGDDEQVVKLEAAKTKMDAKLERLKSKQQRARKLQARFASEIEKAEAIWEATVQMIEVQRLGGDAEEQALQEFESKTAFKSINEEFNAAVADLEEEADSDGEFTVQAEPSLKKESSAFPVEARR